MGVTACQDPHEEPGTASTISDGRKGQGPRPDGRKRPEPARRGTTL